MEAKILALLKENLPDINFESSDKLMDDEILDSAALVEVVFLLSEEFGIEFPYEIVNAEHFNSIQTIAKTVEDLLK